MGIKKMALVAAVGMSMASAPVMAQTSAPMSTAPAIERSGADLDDASDQFRRRGAPVIITIFVVLVIGLGLAVAFDLFDDDNDGRVSP